MCGVFFNRTGLNDDIEISRKNVVALTSALATDQVLLATGKTEMDGVQNQLNDLEKQK